MKPFGQQGSGVLLNVDIVEGFLEPKIFMEKYVLRNNPVVMKGAAKVSPAWKKWTDEYLAKSAPPSPEGDITYEEGKKEDRGAGAGTIHFKKFIETYNSSDIYMVHDVPTWMMPDLVVPGSLQCKKFEEGGLDNTIMWFSSGGTSSVVHNDAYENINCLYRGSKTLIMVNSTKYADLVPSIVDQKDGLYNHFIDVDKVDVEKYPVFSKLEYHVAHMHPGDCLYIPYLWIHQVRSFNESNMAVNIWWYRRQNKKVDLTQCNKEMDENLTFDKVVFINDEFTNRYLADFKEFRRSLKVESAKTDMPESDFVQFIVEGCDALTKNKVAMGYLKKLFSLLDKNKDSVINKKDFEQSKEKKVNTFRMVSMCDKFDKHLLREMDVNADACNGMTIFKSNDPKKQADNAEKESDEPAAEKEKEVEEGEEGDEEGGEEEEEELLDEPHDEL